MDYLDYGASSMFGGMIIAVILVCIALTAFALVVLWQLFVKMGVEGWKAIIPGWNLWIMCEKLFGNGLYMFCVFLSIIPVVGNFLVALFFVIFNIRLARAFDKPPVFVVGLFFLSPVFEAILAFGSAQYTQLEPYDIRNPFN